MRDLRTVDFIVSVVLLINVAGVMCFMDLEQLNRKATYLEGKVGSHVIFNCPLDFPTDSPIPYVLRWLKDVSLYKYFQHNVPTLLYITIVGEGKLRIIALHK